MAGKRSFILEIKCFTEGFSNKIFFNDFLKKPSDFQKILLNSKEERKIFSECYTFLKSLLFELIKKPKFLARCILNQTKEEMNCPAYTNLIKSLTNSFFDDIMEKNVMESKTLQFIYLIMQAKIFF